MLETLQWSWCRRVHCKVERREEEGKVEKEGEEGKKDKDRSALARVSCSIAITIPLLDLSLCNH